MVIDYSSMSDAQQYDPELQAAQSKLRLEDITFTGDGTTLLCDVSTGRARPLVPTSWR